MACLSWLNIGVQFALPISAAFTPAIAARVNQPTFLPAGGEVATLATRPYTLAPGETVETVAARYNMTPDALRKLNQFRSFARGWAQLRPGDELDVPTAPLPKVVWEGGAKVASAPTSGDTQTQRAAGLASRVGGFLGSNPNGEAASSLARGMATGAAGGEIQQWLNQFGTARVQLDADKQFSLKNSRLELLVPLHEQKDKLVFTQGSVHRTDERTQANLGLGYRWFADGWMLGGNTFLDHDISRSHTRMGVGVEYWRDFLKLGANSYMRLSGWKDSPDVTDYEERPANGWDVRAQAWVPAMPQLGGKLTYEQYYGNEVGLFGKDNRQRDPHAITAGVNYTPVPLLTFNAEHRQGQSGKNDARLGVEMRYQLGVPWRQQLDPGAISALRSLAGSRHDLVERNNNIVLEYRKKEVIRLHMAETVSGRAGEKKSLGVSVTSKYGLSRIEWHAPALLAAGGKIVHDGAAGYSVVLPAYQTVAGGVNTYTVGGVAIDMRDNVSNHSETQVTVLAPVISESLSSFMPASSTLLADGQSTQVLTLTLKDAQGGVVDVAESEVAIGVGDGRALKSARLSALKKTGPGIYAVTVTAGKDGEVVALTPVVSGVTLPAARVTINDMAPAAAQSTLVATPDAIVADNRALTTLTLTLKNAAGDALSGLASQLALAIAMPDGASRTADALTLSPVKEGSQKGVYTATFKGAVAGKYTLVPEYNGSAIGNLSATVTLRASAAVKATSAITVTGETFVSGSDIPVTVTLKDAQGNAVSGQTDSLKDVAVPNAVLKGTWAETAANSGVYRATYTAQQAGTGLQATLKVADGSVAST
nr:LysM peptidoglycan-binding domain-containing protein [Serratia marcescens]